MTERNGILFLTVLFSSLTLPLYFTTLLIMWIFCKRDIMLIAVPYVARCVGSARRRLNSSVTLSPSRTVSEMKYFWQTRNDVMLIYPPGARCMVSSDRFWKAEATLIFMYVWHDLLFVNRFQVIWSFYFGCDSLISGDILLVFGENDPKRENFRNIFREAILLCANCVFRINVPWSRFTGLGFRHG